MSVYLFGNDKGGVGKTTNAVNFALWLHRQGKKVVVADADPRASACDFSAAANANERDIPLFVILPHADIAAQVARLRQSFDYVIIDSMSSFVDSARAQVIAALIKGADYVLIPIGASDLDLWAVEELTDMILTRQAITDGKPRAAYFFNAVKENTSLFREMYNCQGYEYKLPVLKSVVPQLEDYKKYLRRGQCVLDLPQNNEARKRFEVVAHEIEDFCK